MITINSIRDLKKLPASDEFVYVQTVNKLFHYNDGWIERAYFKSSEAQKIIGLDHSNQLLRLMEKAGIPNKKGEHVKLTLREIQRLKQIKSDCLDK